MSFQLLPGYGERRWNSDILGVIKRAGGKLREAADAIVTELKGAGESVLVGIEFCAALPAGNQAWQRHGRAFSFAQTGIPFFYVTELGGFELDSERGRVAQRMPNPAVPFSFFATTQYQESICLPVYEANSGATKETIESFASVFGREEFLGLLEAILLGHSTEDLEHALSEKCLMLVRLLADSKKRQDGLTGEQWEQARNSLADGGNIPDFLYEEVQIPWKKTAYIEGLTASARSFMDLGSAEALGLTSKSLPMSFVPKVDRPQFSKDVKALYDDATQEFIGWLAESDKHLALAWVMGFKPGGGDARPDRGLPPLARMLVGDECDLLTFVYGPVPHSHWRELAEDPASLAARNGLWEAVFGVSDAVLIDSSTKPDGAARAYLSTVWNEEAEPEEMVSLDVEPNVLLFGEQDVDTTLHVAFESLGSDIVFEGMCNPPGGDWSGISFRRGSAEPELRWLTLPRVSAAGAKRPDHVFAIFGHGEHPICLCVESKERAQDLDRAIGPRLIDYARGLFCAAPSIHRLGEADPWAIFDEEWECGELVYGSAGAYLAGQRSPFYGLPANTGLDVQIAIAFEDDGRRARLHLRGDTEIGQALVAYLSGLTWGDLVALEVSN